MKIAILCGGNSSERDISLRSGRAVAAALETKHYEVTVLDTQEEWEAIKHQMLLCDVAFPVLHGAGGEDGTIQRLLEDINMPYVGSGIEASEVCFDKWRYKQLLNERGVTTPKGELVDANKFWLSQLIHKPYVLKPLGGGSSIDTIIARDPAKVDRAQVEDIFSRNPHMLLEELITGTEITVGVLGTKALPVIEIIPPDSGEFDFENKYNGKTQELCPPQNVDEAVQEKAQRLAEQVHAICGCKDMSRTDMIVAADNTLYVLETNTIPGMTDQSLLPKAAQAHGLSMPDLVDTLVQTAIQA